MGSLFRDGAGRAAGGPRADRTVQVWILQLSRYAVLPLVGDSGGETAIHRQRDSGNERCTR
jgi:hypothetical protein